MRVNVNKTKWLWLVVAIFGNGKKVNKSMFDGVFVDDKMKKSVRDEQWNVRQQRAERVETAMVDQRQIPIGGRWLHHAWRS